MQEKIAEVLVVPTPSCCSLSRSSLDRKVAQEIGRIGSEYGAGIKIKEANTVIPEQSYSYYKKVREQKPAAWQAMQRKPSNLAKLFPLVLVNGELIWTGVEPFAALDDAIRKSLSGNRHLGVR